MMAHRRVDRSPTQASQEAGLEGEESREETDRQEVASQEEVARPQEKEVASKDSIFTRDDYVKLNLRGNRPVSPSALRLISTQHATTPS